MKRKRSQSIFDRRNSDEKDHRQEIIMNPNSSASGSNIKHLPNDVIGEILYNLPYNNIVRLVPVSKNWFGIITDPYFSSMHAAKNKPFSTFYCNDTYGSYMLDIYDNGDFVMTELKKEVGHIVGSCNGVLCSIITQPRFDTVSILNPITNERIDHLIHDRLPDDKDTTIWERYGFCFSPSSNRYKVAKISRSNGNHYTEFKIFTIGVDQRYWRELTPQLFHNLRMHSGMVSFNGALHFIAYGENHRSSSDGYWFILSFNVDDENTTTMTRLPCPYSLYLELMVFDNSLCLVGLCGNKSHKTIWKMVDYGIKGGSCWIRINVGEDSFCGHKHCNNGRCVAELGFSTAAQFLSEYDRLFQFTPNCSSISEVMKSRAFAVQ